MARGQEGNKINAYQLSCLMSNIGPTHGNAMILRRMEVSQYVRVALSSIEQGCGHSIMHHG